MSHFFGTPDPPLEAFVPVSSILAGSSAYVQVEKSPVIRCAGLSQSGLISFKAPWDFRSLVAATYLVIPRFTNAAARYDISISYGRQGEPLSQHTASSSDSYNVTDAIIFRIDISGILTALAAEDVVGIQCQQAAAGDSLDILGLQFIWRRL